ncbi:MAG: amino acid permease [Leptospiraceae bacterium]|nr:amino acid permease [Leptospiraceae bacterium]MBK9502752.1 amino acid permease [Leptospiraceae bacterium]MBL0262805.1 amino acid permease [Leptospiraceae bacterium]MBP9161804.1 amino acid permease [Leptospiraceae bacterium]
MKHHTFNRTIGLTNAIILMMGNMIGIGIFVYPSLISSLLPHSIWFLLFWLFGGIIAISGALSSAELASVYPELGGDYAYLRNSYGRRWAFLYGFFTFFITFPGSIALGLSLSVHYQGAIILGDWVNTVCYSLPVFGFELHYYQVIAITLLLILTIVNHFGIESSIRFQKLVTFLPVVFLVGVGLLTITSILYYLFFGSGTKLLLADNMSKPFTLPDLLPSGTALVAIYWTYAGWNSPLAMGEEIKNPEKVIPRTMIFGPLVVMFIYLLLAFIFVALLPFESIQTGKDPFFIVGQYFLKNLLQLDSPVFIEWIPRIMTYIIFFIILGNTNSTIITGSRIQVAMSRDRLFIEKLGHLDPKTNTPVLGIWMQSMWALCMILFVSKESNLLNFSFICIIALSILTIYSVFRVKKHHNKPHLIPYLSYPLAPIVYIVTTSLILVLILGNYFREGNYIIPFFAFLSALAGFILYEIWKRIKITTDGHG